MTRVDAESCHDCVLAHASRRQFLRNAALLVAGGLTGLPAAASALTPRLVRALNAGDPKVYAVPDTDSVNIDHDADVIIARWHDEVFAFSLACPHQNTALRWEQKDQEFRCPKHHSTFTAEGVLIQGRAKRSMDRFAVSMQGGNLLVDLNLMYSEDQDPDLWKAAVVRL